MGSMASSSFAEEFGDSFHSLATRPASEASREAVVGEVIAGDARLGGAVLVAPRLALLAADALYYGEKAHQEASFRVQGCSTAVVRSWKVGACALAEL